MEEEEVKAAVGDEDEEGADEDEAGNTFHRTSGTTCPPGNAVEFMKKEMVDLVTPAIPRTMIQNHRCQNKYLPLLPS